MASIVTRVSTGHSLPPKGVRNYVSLDKDGEIRTLTPCNSMTVLSLQETYLVWYMHFHEVSMPGRGEELNERGDV